MQLWAIPNQSFCLFMADSGAKDNTNCALYDDTLRSSFDWVTLIDAYVVHSSQHNIFLCFFSNLGSFKF